MPAVGSRETIPNFPLNGLELAQYAVKVFEQVCAKRNLVPFVAEPAIAALKQALESDWVFKSTFTYSDVNFEIALQAHCVRNHETRAAFTLIPTFRFPNLPTIAKAEPFVRRPLHITAPPLDSFPPDAEHLVDCFTVRVKVSNPNLVRVHFGMPIMITEKIQPGHGEMFGQIKNHELRYNPASFEPLPEPEVIEQSAEFAQKWGVVDLRWNCAVGTGWMLPENFKAEWDGTVLTVGGQRVSLLEARETLAQMVAADTPELREQRQNLTEALDLAELDQLTAPEAQGRSVANSKDSQAGTDVNASIDASTPAESGKKSTLATATPAHPPQIPRPPVRSRGAR